MRRIVIAIGLTVALIGVVVPDIAHARESQIFALEGEEREATRFVRQATGRLVIAPDGRPTDITIEAGELRIEAMYRRIISAWRFAPVLREGVPSAVSVDMNLTLSADRIEGSTRRVRYGVANVEFMEGTDPADGDVELLTSDLKPPVFPMRMAMAGVGARLLMLVEVDRSGRVVRGAVADADLYARQTSSGRAAASQVERFAKATLEVIEQWTIGEENVLESGWALVPVNFAVPGTTPMDWTPVLPMTVSRLDWMAEPLAEAQALSSVGRSLDESVQLLTPMEPLVSQ